jgi:hypothetical protein
MADISFRAILMAMRTGGNIMKLNGTLFVGVLLSIALTIPTVAEAQKKGQGNANVVAKCRQKYPEPATAAEKRGQGQYLAAMRRQCIQSGGKK